MLQNFATLCLVTIGAFVLNIDNIVIDTYKTHRDTEKAADLNLHDSIVVVQNGSGHGTGFFVGKNLIMTNEHVVANAKTLVVQLYNGAQYGAELVASNSDMDLALLRINYVSTNVLELAKANIPIGRDVFMLGHGSFNFYTLERGTSGRMYPFIGDNWNNNQQLLTIGAIGGFSGSPVLDSNTGKVVGVLAGGSADPRAKLGIMIPILDVRDFLKNAHLKKKAKPKKVKEKVVYISLTIPAAAVSKHQEGPLRKYCKEKGVQIIRKDDMIIFEGAKKYLITIANYILRNGELK